MTSGYEDLLTLLGGLQGLREMCVRYCPREYIHVRTGYFNIFYLLEYLEKEDNPREYAMFYEIFEAQTEPDIRGMLPDHWAIGERRKIDMKE
jgi:hypothetical protein